MVQCVFLHCTNQLFGMFKLLLIWVFLIFTIFDVSAQFNSIYRSNVQKELIVDNAVEKVGEQGKDEKENGFFKKELFRRLRGLFKTEKDSVPTDANLFSYDKPEGNGFFIFTERQEKAYLDSLKIVLIKKRHEILTKRTMMSLPMDMLQITSSFGYRTDPFTGERKFHNGIDFRARNNFIYPVLPGVVIKAGYRGGYGYCIEVQHGDLGTLYAHLSYILVREGQVVPAGEPIGISGTTGRSTGEHLHFSVTQNGKFINPAPVLEYIAGELADRNQAKEVLLAEKGLLELDMEKEKMILKDLQARETAFCNNGPEHSIVYGGKNGRSFSGRDHSEGKRNSSGIHIIRRDTMGANNDNTVNDSVGTQNRPEIIRTNTGTRILFGNTKDNKVEPKGKGSVRIHTAKK